MRKSEIESRYRKLIREVETKEFYTRVDLTNRINCYTCGRGHILKTRDIDSGVTPMFMRCDICGMQATSTGYTDLSPEIPPTKEWYRPSIKQLLKLNTKEWSTGTVEHVLSGGLMIRKIKS